jgi:mono/diheme cytochrome c family protein
MKTGLPIALLTAATLQGAALSADSIRGAQVFDEQGCVQCHALKGVGARIGPDLGLVADRGFTPATMAATMWNHAPRMWTEIRLLNVARPVLDEQQAADLFAFFYSLRFFEEPGDAARGKALFRSKKCIVCHSSTQPGPAGSKPVSEWTLAYDPLELVEVMWNHSTAMLSEMERKGIRLPLLTGQELADLLVYARRTVGQTRVPSPVFHSDPEQGKALFDSKRCASCHGEIRQFLSGGLRDKTLTGIAADMWNHGRDMRLRDTTFAPGEMRQIADFIWFSRVIEGRGESGAGARVFAAKNCSVCHNDPSSGAPSLTGLAANGRLFSAVTMVSVLTRHGPAMLERMRERHLPWPQFTTTEMSGLIAWLNTRTAHNGR